MSPYIALSSSKAAAAKRRDRVKRETEIEANRLFMANLSLSSLTAGDMADAVRKASRNGKKNGSRYLRVK